MTKPINIISDYNKDCTNRIETQRPLVKKESVFIEQIKQQDIFYADHT